jgi:uncharacterized protein YdgA (DUF945 family)
MKKLWLPLLIVVIWLVLFVAGPYYTGGKMEEKLDGLITKLNTNGIVKFEKTSYDKGLMSSETVLTMTVNTEMFGQALQQYGGAPKIDPVSLRGEVKHGPILLDNGFEFAIGRISFVPEVSEEHQQKIAEVFGTENPLNVSIQFNWDKSFKLDGSLVEFSMADKGVSSSKMGFEAELTDAGTRLISSFNWDGMSIKDPKQAGSSFAITKVTSTSDQVQALEEIWVGDGKMGVESISFSQKGMAGNMKALTISASTSVDDGNAYMDGLADISIDKVNVAGADYVEDFSYKISFKHIQLEGLQKIIKAMQEAQQAGGTPEAMQMAMGMQMIGTLPEIVSKGFSINIDELNAKIMGEQVSSSLRIDIAEGTDVNAGMAAIAGVTVNAEVSISKALLSKIPTGIQPEMIQGLVSQGLIIEEAGFLKSKAEFKGGQLTVNGNPMPIPGL